MSKIKVICDSSCDMPTHYEDELNISICSLSVNIDGKTYRERVDLTSQEFLNMLTESKEFPKTSLAGPDLFLEQYKKAESEGYDTILTFTLPAVASGTNQAANIAKEMYLEDGGKCEVDVIDSMLLSYLYGYLVVEAARLALEGKEKQEIMDRVHYLQKHIEVYFSVDTLEYLRKGGRINTAKAVIGTLLDLKPILSIKNGLVEQVEVVRGSKKIIPRMVQLLKAHKGESDFEKVCVGQGGNPETVTKLKEKMTEEFGVTEFEDFDVGIVVGAHTGPGFLAVFVINPDFENDYVN